MARLNGESFVQRLGFLPKGIESPRDLKQNNHLIKMALFVIFPESRKLFEYANHP